MQRALPRNSTATPTSSEDPTHMGPIEVAISCLWVFTPLTATVSLVVVLIAMLTNQWLHTEEKMSNPSYNGTGEKDYLSKYTISGLWMLCFTNRKLQFLIITKSVFIVVSFLLIFQANTKELLQYLYLYCRVASNGNILLVRIWPKFKCCQSKSR